MLTDAGVSTPHLIEHLQRCDALLLEFNHDRDLLAQSSYPAMLKARIGGRLGHLANDTAANVLAACLHAGLRHVVAAHLSEQNNRPALVRQALATSWDVAAGEAVVADPLLGCDWLEVGSLIDEPRVLRRLTKRRAQKSRPKAAFSERVSGLLRARSGAGASIADDAALLADSAADEAAPSAADADSVAAGGVAGAGAGVVGRSGRRRRRGFFLLAAGSERNGGDQGNHQQSFFHTLSSLKGSNNYRQLWEPSASRTPSLQDREKLELSRCLARNYRHLVIPLQPQRGNREGLGRALQNRIKLFAGENQLGRQARNAAAAMHPVDQPHAGFPRQQQ